MSYLKLIILFVLLTTGTLAKGSNALAGADKDQDGVRDDVQAWIDKSYPSSRRESINKGLKQISKYYQLMLDNHLYAEKAVAFHTKSLEAFSCLDWINETEGPFIFKAHQLKFFNTPERSEAYTLITSYKRGARKPEQLVKTPYSERHVFCEFPAIKEIN